MRHIHESRVYLGRTADEQNSPGRHWRGHQPANLVMDLSTVLVALLTVLLVAWLWRQGRPVGMVPGPPYVPVLGSVVVMTEPMLHHQLSKWRKQYGDYFSFLMGSRYSAPVLITPLSNGGAAFIWKLNCHWLEISSRCLNTIPTLFFYCSEYVFMLCVSILLKAIA